MAALYQQFMGAWTSIIGDATNYANPLVSGAPYSTSTVAANHTPIMPAGGTIRNLRVTARTAMGGGTSAVFTVMKNGVDTAITVTLNSTTQSADNTTGVSFAATDTITFKRVTAGFPAGNVYFFSLEWEPTTANQSIYGWGNNAFGSNLAANDHDGIFAGGQQADNTPNVDLVGVGGTLTVLTVSLSAAPGVGNSRVFTVWLNGSATAHVLTISGAATTGTLTFSQTLAAADRQSVKHTITGTPAASVMSGAAAFTSSVANAWNMCGWCFTSIAAAGGTVFMYPAGDLNSNIPTTTESDWRFRAPIRGFSIYGLRGALGAAPGSGKSWAYTVRLNAADSAQTISIADAATTAGPSAGAAVAIVSGDFIGFEFTPTSSPASTVTEAWALIASTSPAEIKGSTVFGAYGTVTSSLTFLANLDGVTRTVSAPGSLFVGGNVALPEQAVAPTAISNTALLYAIDNGSGKTRLMVLFPTGAAIQLSIEA